MILSVPVSLRYAAFYLGVLCLSACALDPIKDPKPWAPTMVTPRQWSSSPSCIAFSGGGIRSAAFSIGVMQGLNDAGLLASADVISSTSGGSYAASWLYTAVRGRNLSINESLSQNSAEQNRIAKEAWLFVDPAWAIWTAGAGSATAGPWNAVNRSSCKTSNPSQDLLLTGASLSYQTAIDFAFHGRKRTFFSSIISDDEGHSLPELVIGVTLLPGLTPPCDQETLLKSMNPGEISSRGLVSRGVVYRNDISTWGTREVVASAGGATDISKPNGEEKVTLCNLPRMVRPLVSSAACTTEIQDSPETYITDGGFTDNLALLPLLDRSCKVIVSIDATHDPHLKFDDLDIRSPELAAAGWEIERLKDDIRKSRPKDKYNADAVDSSVSVQVLPSGKVFAYVKLSIPSAASNSLPELVAMTHALSSEKFSDAGGCNDRKLMERCRFPHESTMRQSFFPSEYMAYRDLGRWITIEQLLMKLETANAISNDESVTKLAPK